MNQEQTPWWDDKRYIEFYGGPELPTVYKLEKIVAEAERRGREKALEEVRKAAIQTVVPLSVTLESEGDAG